MSSTARTFSIIKTPRNLMASVVIGAAAHLVPLPAQAYTECNLTPQRFYVGDGILWVTFGEGGTGTIPQSDPDFKPTLAVFLTAITTQKSVVVRYATDGASCSSLQEIAGVWLAR